MPHLDFFCDFCADLFRRNKGVLPPYENYVVTRAIDQFELLLSASQCALCRLTYSLTRKRRRTSEFPGTAIYKFIVDSTTGALLDFRIQMEWEIAFQLFYFTISLYSNQEDTSRASAPAIEPDHNDLPWAWLAHCIAKCRKSHPGCKLKAQLGKLPTRLIDVGTHASPPCRLILSATLPEADRADIEYITLSHKWGTNSFTVLTRQNIDAFQTCMVLDELPKTFQDAIHFARRVAIRYLWIDSLCILQDSIDDWQAEAPTMHSVYSNGFLNIAASESENPMEGLHPRKHTLAARPIHFAFEHGEARRSFECHYKTWLDLDGLVALSKRGWVLQERLASPRTIHFMSNVMWECRQSTLSHMQPALSDMLAGDKIWVGSGYDIYDKDEAFELWYSTVEAYSKCHLTKKDDKLVAISGLARILQPFTKCDYLAGMWRDDLVRALHWLPGQGTDGFWLEETNHIAQRAPSWSWASVDGPIQMVDTDDFPRSIIKIQGAETISLYDDEFGQLSTGHIALLGRIYSIGSMTEVFDELFDFKFGGLSGLDDDGDNDRHSQDQDVYLLPLSSGPSTFRYGDAGSDQLFFFSLLLQQDKISDDRLAYRRVGYAIVEAEGKVYGVDLQCSNWTIPTIESSLNEEIILV